MNAPDIAALKALERALQARADELQRQARRVQREADATRKRIRKLRRENGERRSSL